MNKRIQQFLELEDMTPARLSEILGIQRSGLSHILAGRNKPSYDFIEKMLNKFPTLNAEWLILGKGKPYKNQNTAQETPVYTTPQLSEQEKSSPEQQVQLPKIEHVTPEIQSEQPHENQLIENNIDNRTPIINSNEVSHKDEKPEIRHISKIILLYSDGTFEER